MPEQPEQTTTELPTPAAIAAHLEALNLAGLAFVAKRMLGRDTTLVAGQFRMWVRSGQANLPALTEPFYDALAPLRIGRPSSTSAAVCDQVLVAREPDGAVGLRAAAEAAAEGKAMFRAAPLPDLGEDARPEAEAARVLVSAVKEFWRAMGALYGDVRPSVLAGDLPRALETLHAGETALADTVAQVAAMAEALAGPDLPGPAPRLMAPRPEATAEVEVVASVTEQDIATAEAGEPTGPLRLSDAQAEAFARRTPLDPQADQPPPSRPVEILSTRPVRNHPFLPVVFLLLVSGIALVVLFTIINDPTNPLR